MDSCVIEFHIDPRSGVAPYRQLVQQVRQALRTLAHEWNTDPCQAAQQPFQALGDVKRRISRAIENPDEPRRTAAARLLGQRRQPNRQEAGNTHETPQARRILPPSRAGLPRTRTR